MPFFALGGLSPSAFEVQAANCNSFDRLTRILSVDSVQDSGAVELQHLQLLLTDITSCTATDTGTWWLRLRSSLAEV